MSVYDWVSLDKATEVREEDERTHKHCHDHGREDPAHELVVPGDLLTVDLIVGVVVVVPPGHVYLYVVTVALTELEVVQRRLTEDEVQQAAHLDSEGNRHVGGSNWTAEVILPDADAACHLHDWQPIPQLLSREDEVDEPEEVVDDNRLLAVEVKAPIVEDILSLGVAVDLAVEVMVSLDRQVPEHLQMHDQYQ